MLLTSPRNSVPAHDILMKLLGCTKLISPTPAAPAVTAIVVSCNVQLLEFPSLEFFLDETHPKYPYVKAYETAKDEPLVVLHTSGSTGKRPPKISYVLHILISLGLPKPLVLPHTFGTAFADTTQVEPPPGYVSQSRHLHGRRMMTTLPLFHVSIYFAFLAFKNGKTVGRKSCNTERNLYSMCQQVHGMCEVVSRQCGHLLSYASMSIMLLEARPRMTLWY